MADTNRSATMLYRRLGRLMLLVHGPGAPTDEDWNEYLLALERFGQDHPTNGALLVVTDGSGPSPAQRNAIRRYARTALDVAVVTASAFARGIVTMLGWFAPAIRAFSPEELDAAFKYLKVGADDASATLNQVAVMRAQLSGVGVDSDTTAAALLRETAVDPRYVIVTKFPALRSELISRRRAGTTEARFSPRD